LQRGCLTSSGLELRETTKSWQLTFLDLVWKICSIIATGIMAIDLLGPRNSHILILIGNNYFELWFSMLLSI
jgi:hypothetical protein